MQQDLVVWSFKVHKWNIQVIDTLCNKTVNGNFHSDFLLKVPTSAFTIKNLFRHYAKMGI